MSAAEGEVAAVGTHYVIEIAVKEVHPERTVADTRSGRLETTVQKRVLTRSKLVSTAVTLDGAVVKAQRLLEIERTETDDV